MSLKEKLNQGQFIISAEIVPPKTADSERQLQTAELYKQHVDVVDITDCPMANICLSSFCLGKKIQDRVGLETIFNFTCRDRNIIGMESDLLGAFSLGVKNILCLWGDPPHLGNRPEAKKVYELDTIKLIKLAKEIGFTVGVAGFVDLSSKNKDNIKNKKEAGADFVITQPIYSSPKVEEAVKLEKEMNLPFLVGILPVLSAKKAIQINKKVPGISIPEEQIKNLEKEGKKAGINNAREIFTLLQKNLSGAHIMIYKEHEIITEIIEN